MQAPVAAIHQRARRATWAAFATQGLVFITLTTRLPRFADRWDLTAVDQSLLLLMVVVLAGVGSVVAGAVAVRRDSAWTVRAGLLGIGVTLPVVTLAPSAVVFVAGLAGYGLALGVVDATSNMQAVALEHQYGRPILPSFHGAWTFGGLIGSGLALATAGLPLAATATLAVIPLVAVAAPYLRRDHGETLEAASEVTDVPWRPILLVGLGMVLFYMVDTAAQTWGPTYLDSTFDTPEQLVALATFPYLLSSLVLRVAGDGLVARYGAVTVLRSGALLAFVALAIVVTAPTWPVAVIGFGLLGAGVSVIAPLSFSAAARIAGGDRSRVDAVIARFNQFNYVGGLLGAVLTGLVGAESLRLGFALPMVLILGMLPLAPAFAPSRPRGGGPPDQSSPPRPGQFLSG
jgi:fucose permease